MADLSSFEYDEEGRVESRQSKRRGNETWASIDMPLNSFSIFTHSQRNFRDLRWLCVAGIETIKMAAYVAAKNTSAR
jgi:hypothetical protein